MGEGRVANFWTPGFNRWVINVTKETFMQDRVRPYNDGPPF
ncbi:hypothetical protein FHT28_005474 [Rhizobium sp. SG570]|nr:hypothetical protein [Rhizobium sp. SG570]